MGVSIGKIIQHEKKWSTLDDSGLIELILRTLVDDDKKNIINAIMKKPMIISDMLKITKTLQTSGHTKVKALIEGGLLVPLEEKSIIKYKSIFEDISISIEKNKVVVKVKPNNYAHREHSEII